MMYSAVVKNLKVKRPEQDNCQSRIKEATLSVVRGQSGKYKISASSSEVPVIHQRRDFRANIIGVSTFLCME